MIVIHWVCWFFADYTRFCAFLIPFLFRLWWWMLHQRMIIAAVLGYDVLKYTGTPLVRHAIWYWRRLPDGEAREAISD